MGRGVSIVVLKKDVWEQRSVSYRDKPQDVVETDNMYLIKTKYIFGNDNRKKSKKCLWIEM